MHPGKRLEPSSETRATNSRSGGTSNSQQGGQGAPVSERSGGQGRKCFMGRGDTDCSVLLAGEEDGD